MSESSFGELSWSLGLTKKEQEKFEVLCRREKSTPGEVLRQLVQIYIRARGRLPVTPQELDRVVNNLAGWWIQPCPPAAKRVRRKTSARTQHKA